MRRLLALLRCVWAWMGDAAEASHRGQRDTDTWAAEPADLDEYDRPDHPQHRKDPNE